MAIESKGLNATRRLASEWWAPGLAGPVIAAAIVRLGLLATAFARTGTAALIGSDTSSYLIPGRNLLLHGRFYADGVPDLLRTPGYSLFLALTSLAGLPAAAVANVLLSILSVILVWKIGRKVADDGRIALGAAWIFAFEPLSVANSIILESESLFLALFLLSLERLVVFLREHSLRALAASGLWLAAATLVRPVTYYLPVALALGVILVLAHEHGLRWKASALLLVCTLPWLAAWQIRNRAVAGYSGISSISDLNLYFYVAGDVTARAEHRPFPDLLRELGFSRGLDGDEQAYLYPPYLAVHPEQAGWTQGQRLAFMHSEAVRVIRAHGKAYLRMCVVPLFVMAFDPGAGTFNYLLSLGVSQNADALVSYRNPVSGAILLARAHPWLAVEKAAFVLVLLGVYLLAARGVRRGRIHKECLWLLLGTSLYFIVVSAMVGGMGSAARYRLPIMPIVCILAAAGALRSRRVDQ